MKEIFVQPENEIFPRGLKFTLTDGKFLLVEPTNDWYILGSEMPDFSNVTSVELRNFENYKAMKQYIFDTVANQGFVSRREALEFRDFLNARAETIYQGPYRDCMIAFFKLIPLPELKEIRFENCCLTSGFLAQSLYQLPHLANIETLSLGSICGLDEHFLYHLSALENLQSLTIKTNWSTTKIMDDIVENSYFLPDFNELWVLPNLVNFAIEDFYVKYNGKELLKLHAFTELHSLEISVSENSGPISSHIIESLRNALENTTRFEVVDNRVRLPASSN